MKFDTVPTVFVGTQFWQSNLNAPQIEAAVAQAIQHGATGKGDTITGHSVPMPAPGTQNSTAAGTLANTPALPLPLFITTAVISGVNPCVFAVLIFLMGTIALTGSRARALAIGVTYIVTVFIVFFLSALAIVQFVQVIGLQNLDLTKTLIGIFLLVVGIVSIKDFFWYNRWFSFKIPTFTKRSISTLGNTGSFLAIIGLGIIATIAALPCTLRSVYLLLHHLFDQHGCDSIQPLHSPLRICIHHTDDHRFRCHIWHQGGNGQGRGVENAISALYEACGWGPYGHLWPPARVQGVLS